MDHTAQRIIRAQGQRAYAPREGERHEITIDRQALPGLLETAWRLVAPKTLIAKFDGAR